MKSRHRCVTEAVSLVELYPDRHIPQKTGKPSPHYRAQGRSTDTLTAAIASTTIGFLPLRRQQFSPIAVIPCTG
jgi:hypothetical protein